VSAEAFWWILMLQNPVVVRAGLRGGNGGNCPGPFAARGPHVMKFICFK